MIPTENLLKESLLKFKGTYCRWQDVFYHLNMLLPLTSQQDLDLQQSLKAIGEENLIIPLDFVKSSTLPQDKKGCRIYDWKILSTPQVKNAMKLNGHYQRIVATSCVPMTAFFSDDFRGFPNSIPIEKYDKFLNVTYLVNDEFLQDWCNPHYDEKNVAKKKVKNCSVSELLFAIKKKLDNQNFSN